MIRIIMAAKEFSTTLFATLMSLFIWALGGIDYLVYSLMYLMVLDYITGIMVGFKNDKINSKRAYKGIKKKIMVWFLFTSSVVLGRITGYMHIRSLVAIFYCVTEILSIVENIGKYGVPIPKILKKTLEQCHEDDCLNKYDQE